MNLDSTKYNKSAAFDVVKYLYYLILAASFMLTTTCKKIRKYPVNICGMWYAPESNCGMSITINKNGLGKYYSNFGYLGCGIRPVQGKVRFTKTHFYIGTTRYKFINKPEITNSNDSLDTSQVLGNIPSKSKILATMTLKNPFLHTGAVLTYYKIEDY